MIFHGLGDCINSTIVIDALRRRHADCEIYWVTCEQYKDVVLYNNLVTGTITVPESPLTADKHYGIHQLPGKTITPAPYMNARLQGSLLDHFRSLYRSITGKELSYIIPTINLSLEEVNAAKNWLASINLLNKRFAILETRSGSSATHWDQSCTLEMLRLLVHKKYDAVLLTHPADNDLSTFNEIIPTFCMNVGYRLIIPIYNLSSFFCGCGSAATVLTHTNQALTNIPHMEFVRGSHWSSELYKPKQRKKIVHSDHLNPSVLQQILATARELTS